MADYFRYRRLRLKFEIEAGQTGGKKEVFEIEGLRCSVNYQHSYTINGTQANIVVYGLTLEHMRAMTIVREDSFAISKSFVSVIAVDDNSEVLVFKGAIFSAIADFNQSPNVPFVIQATAQQELQQTLSIPRVFEGSQSVQTICTSIVEVLNNQLGQPTYSVQVHGDLPRLENVSLQGDYWTMLKSVADMVRAGIWQEGGVIHVGKPDAPVNTDVLLLNSENGMIGYPTLTPNGCVVKAVWGSQYQLNKVIRVQSAKVLFRNSSMKVDSQTGKLYQYSEADFMISKMVTRIDAEVPNGAWEVEMLLVYRNQMNG